MTNCDHSNGWMDLPDNCSDEGRIAYVTEPPIERNRYGLGPDIITFDDRVRLLFSEAAELLLSKHHDYGPLNIALSPGGPVNGLRVRLHDKLARLNHLVDSGAEPQHESLEDTWRDIIGYGAIGLLVSRGDWPSE